ncbi:GNAT family N-acetyltransferase [Pseudomonadota bacterium AL_CKDN230030165-1A_HGKHYDSX7]
MSLNPRDITISTGRLLLRPFESHDFEAYAAYHALPDVYRYLYAPAPAGEALRAQFDDLLDAPFENDGDTLRLAVTRGEDGVLLGEVLLKHAQRSALQGEVGYIFDPRHAGRGYATEAVTAMVSLGFDTIGLHRIFARLDAANAGSIGVVERLGMRREAHLIQNDRYDGVWGDEFVYAVLAREWAARRQTTR